MFYVQMRYLSMRVKNAKNNESETRLLWNIIFAAILSDSK